MASEAEIRHAERTKGFCRPIDIARAASVAKHGRPVVVVMTAEEVERLQALETAAFYHLVIGAIVPMSW